MGWSAVVAATYLHVWGGELEQGDRSLRRDKHRQWEVSRTQVMAKVRFPLSLSFSSSFFFHFWFLKTDSSAIFLFIFNLGKRRFLKYSTTTPVTECIRRPKEISSTKRPPRLLGNSHIELSNLSGEVIHCFYVFSPFIKQDSRIIISISFLHSKIHFISVTPGIRTYCTY